MNVLTLDLSTSTGWSLLQGERGDKKPTILAKGAVALERPILAYGAYPWCYLEAASTIAATVRQIRISLEDQFGPIDVIVIEETNLGKNRYAQKMLEFIHSKVLDTLLMRECGREGVVYLSSSSWRQALGLTMTKDDKKNNKKLGDAKAKAKVVAQQQGISVAKALGSIKKEMGIKGRVNKKHVAIRYINDLYGLNLKMKDDDVADALCLGVAYLNGAIPCDGV